MLLRKDGKYKQALAITKDILRGRDGPFVEPTRFLQCRLDLERAERATAATCLARFVRDYPASPHHALALQMAVELSVAMGDCGSAAVFAGQYLARHPSKAFADQASKIRSNCGR